MPRHCHFDRPTKHVPKLAVHTHVVYPQAQASSTAVGASKYLCDCLYPFALSAAMLRILYLALMIALALGLDEREDFVSANKNMIDPRIKEPIATVAAAAIAPVFRPGSGALVRFSMQACTSL